MKKVSIKTFGWPHETSLQHVNEMNKKFSFENMPLPELKIRLDFKSEGLSQQEAQRRFGQYGYNELAEKAANPLLKFLGYFWGPIPWMIESAVVLAAIVRDWADFFIISALLFVNAVVGFWEEFQAGNAIAALKSKLALRAKVKRDSKWKNLPARELVPGDVIRIRIGDIVPADAKLLEGDPVEIDQSALTGESLPVERKTQESVYSGSIIKRGEIDALVYGTGNSTYFGKTAELVEKAHTVSHFQRAIMKIGNYLIMVALVLVSVILAVAFVREHHMLRTLEFVLILTVAAIPVAMPTVLSVTMAIGAKILAKNEAIVSRLASVEELAGINVLCSDKTGTLTQNRLQLGEPFVAGGSGADDVITAAALASRREDEDTIDLTVLQGVRDPQRLASYRILHFMPFDPVQKRTEATIEDPSGKQFMVTKGAAQVILALSNSSDALKKEAQEKINSFASRGFRSLGVARAFAKDQWEFLGIIPLFDPPREDSKSTIDTAEEMGISVKMLTGDQMAIARETAKQLDLGTNILDAAVLADTEKGASSRIAREIEAADGFAQVFPEHKYKIVELLQEKGDIVGMTGDGVNDAPALKKADVGIAVSGATDAAKAAAAIVLLRSGLSVIIEAVKESRKIFQRMNSYAIYRIAETIRVLLFMTLSILVFNFYPVTAVMIVLLALLNDGAIISIAYDNVRYSRNPEKWNMPLVLGIATVLGLAGVVASFSLFYLAENVFHLGRDSIQTLMYLKLSVAGHLTIFLTRTRGPFWSERPAPILLFAVIGTQVLATLIALSGIFMKPIAPAWTIFIWVYAFIWFLINDRIKLLVYSFFNKHGFGM